VSKILRINPEFSCEIQMVVPYAYWLHKRGELKTIITSKGMKPFYYFHDDVREEFDYRSVDNYHMEGQIPNIWIHHNSKAVTGKDYNELTEQEQYDVNGVLDYSQWTPPPLKEYYSKQPLQYKFVKPYVVVSNRYNYEHGKPPRGFFDIKCLYDMFNYLTEKGYAVIYKRPDNTEFPLDHNEMLTIQDGCKLEAEVEGIGLISDYELCEYYDDVFLLDDLIADEKCSYNEGQLKLFSKASGFISMGGGSGILCSYFGGTNITYITTSAEMRKGYFGEKSHYRMTSGCNVIPIRDAEDEISKRGYRDYTELFKKVKENF
tara:strand:+ start:15 stop:968 length:954 start_codon:yes stop_codon:yes gene_type:complete